MIEPEISLAFSIQSKKGIYAVLLGSGVSRSAAIPTGWDIVLLLINKIAVAKKEDCEGNPEKWYKEKYKKPPDYSDIIDQLAKTPSEKNNILASYIEPSAEDIEQKKKIPTQAHKSIAQLVKQGFIKIILTTNFDRLMESALEEIGIKPTVISTPDAIQGVQPLQHTEVLIIKLHGDYKDTRIKNSENELADYDDQLNTLLDRIFDEYGLIICGWSGDWDIALRDAFSRCKSHRFTTYWTYVSKLGEEAEKLIKLRRAELINIKGADSFFKELEEKVLAIEAFNKPHPLSAKTAVATVKKLLRDEKQDIHLSDFIKELTENTYSNLSPENFPTDKSELLFDKDNLIIQLEKYQSITEILLEVLIAGAYWGDEKQSQLWVNSLQRICNPTRVNEGNAEWISLKYYPAKLLFYGASLSSLISKKYQTFANLCNNIKLRMTMKEKKLYYYLLDINTEPLRNDVVKMLNNSESIVASNEYMCSQLRESFRDYLPSNIEYEKAFDYFEYILSLILADEFSKNHGGNIWGPAGIFAFRATYSEDGTHLVNADNISVELIKEQKIFGNEWWPLKVGFFDGSEGRFNTIKKEYDSFINKALKEYSPRL